MPPRKKLVNLTEGTKTTETNEFVENTEPVDTTKLDKDVDNEDFGYKKSKVNKFKSKKQEENVESLENLKLDEQEQDKLVKSEDIEDVIPTKYNSNKNRVYDKKTHIDEEKYSKLNTDKFAEYSNDDLASLLFVRFRKEGNPLARLALDIHKTILEPFRQNNYQTKNNYRTPQHNQRFQQQPDKKVYVQTEEQGENTFMNRNNGYTRNNNYNNNNYNNNNNNNYRHQEQRNENQEYSRHYSRVNRDKPNAHYTNYKMVTSERNNEQKEEEPQAPFIRKSRPMKFNNETNTN